MARGAYLMFMDSDDWVEPHFVQMMMEHKDSQFMPVCGYVNHDEAKNGRTDIFGWPDESEPISVGLKDGLLLLYNHRLLQMIWNKLFCMDVIRRHQLQFDPVLFCGEDFRFLLEYLRMAQIEGFVFLNHAPYHYLRDNPSSLATRFTEIAIEEPLKNLEMMYTLIATSASEMKELLRFEKEKQLQAYAYSFMHDEHLTFRERKQKILQLPLADGKSVWKQQNKLYKKEQLRKLLRR